MMLTMLKLLSPQHYRRPGEAGRLPRAHPALLLLAGLACATVAVLAGGIPSAPLALAAPLLAWIDADVHRLPDALSRPVTIATVLAIIASALVAGDLLALGRAVCGGLAYATFMLGLAIVAGVGLGDVKLAVPIGAASAWVSWQMLAWAVLLGWVINGVAALVLLGVGRSRRDQLPFGPALLAGWMVALVTANAV